MRHILLVLAAAAAVVVAGAEPVLRQVTDFPTAVSSGVSDADALFCDSWRLSVETANAGPWRTVPARCGRPCARTWRASATRPTPPSRPPIPRLRCAGIRVGRGGSHAGVGVRRRRDAALQRTLLRRQRMGAFASGVGGAMPAWVFDVDETLLSNAPYYAVSGWGLQEFNETSFDAWVDIAKAPALPSSLKLYNELQGLGFHIILLTGRSELQRNATEENLLFAGYHSWEKLILRQISDIGKTAVQYKSERRAAMEAEGFKILGNSGDQWSDLIGLPMATRSFKLPNPMYFIS
uniref:Acid phosphatase 1 n=1 Tax=Aegilops tauschii TaxID=37682 RepID=N1QV38_AEGTA